MTSLCTSLGHFIHIVSNKSLNNDIVSWIEEDNYGLIYSYIFLFISKSNDGFVLIE